MWSSFFGQARVLHLPPFGSDHNPLLIGAFALPPNDHKAPKQIRFENYCVQEEGCDELVLRAWGKRLQGHPMYQLRKKIEVVRLALMPWQRVTFRERNEEMDSIREKLQALLLAPITEVVWQESKDLNTRLERLLQAEHDHWKQRAKVKWMQDGDKNSNFFHQKATSRQKKNALGKLQDEIGVVLTSAVGMESIMTRYFHKMFSSNEVIQNDMERVIDLIPRVVTGDINVELDKVVEDEEVRKALFNMHPSKSPGPDGMSPFFFQYYWDLVSPLVCEAVRNFIGTGIYDGEGNQHDTHLFDTEGGGAGQNDTHLFNERHHRSIIGLLPDSQ